jgi:membrane protein
VASASTSAFDRLRRFLEVRIWDVRPAELPRLKAALFRAGRIAYSTARALLDDRLTFRAAALTYFSVLSVVPFLAFAFAVLKGFGAYRAFVDGTLRPYLAATFSANPALHDAIDRILQFVDQTDVSKLGAAGVVFLVYTSVSLVANVEVALNEIFGAQKRRALLRQVTDYVTLLVTAPLLLFAATTFSAAAQSSSIVRFLRETLGLGFMIDFALRFTSIAVVGVALFAIYLILPNVRVRPPSALLGAALAAIGWQGLLVLHVKLQLGVARYNALYSVLGAIPIFLVWTYFSWLIVLVGATIAAAHQNDQLVRQRLRGERADEALRETIAVAAAAQIARDFLAGTPRRTAAELGELLEVPPPAIEEILEALVRAGLLVRAVSGREIGYVPGRDLDQIRAADLRDALRRDPAAEDIRAAVERQLRPELQRMLRASEEERRSSPHNATLRELAALAPAGPVDPRDARSPRRQANRVRDDVLDAKEPDLPV